MPHARVGDIDMYYERQGEGPPLLFISGTGGDLRVKPNVFDGALARSVELLAFDQRGLGQTSKPDQPYSMGGYADDAAGLMDSLGWESALVVGVSFGGMVAQELVLRHPTKVRRLVLACTSPGGAGGASFPFHEIEGMDRLERSRMLIHAMGAHRQLEARSAHDTWGRLPDIACPVMVAAGRYDGIAVPDTQQRMAARIPGARLRFFEGGHLFMIQDRAAVPAMTEFLQG
jgi:3-oxoadipate enol-lactonase